MRTLVVGDVHGCADELRKLIDRVRADTTLLVGDLFTKGPDALGVWRLIHERGLLPVLGNHDARMLDVVDGKKSADAEVKRAIDALSDVPWVDWTRNLPLFREAAGFTIVHAGLHPSGDLLRTTRKMAIAMRRWPEETPENPHWYQVYEGERRVVFGHDAVVGLVRIERDGRPWCIGLDTGCCYGGSLSGYVLEEDRIEQVKAARAYRPFVP